MGGGLPSELGVCSRGVKKPVYAHIQIRLSSVHIVTKEAGLCKWSKCNFSSQLFCFLFFCKLHGKNFKNLHFPIISYYREISVIVRQYHVDLQAWNPSLPPPLKFLPFTAEEQHSSLWTCFVKLNAGFQREKWSKQSEIIASLFVGCAGFCFRPLWKLDSKKLLDMHMCIMWV